MLPGREIIFLDFIKKVSIQGAEYFLKSITKTL